MEMRSRDLQLSGTISHSHASIPDRAGTRLRGRREIVADIATERYIHKA